MRIAVPKETAPGERRVALVPESCKKLKQAGYDLSIQSGADVQRDRAALFANGDLVLTVTAPTVDDVQAMRPGAIYVGSLMPLRHLEAARALAARKVTAFPTA